MRIARAVHPPQEVDSPVTHQKESGQTLIRRPHAPLKWSVTMCQDEKADLEMENQACIHCHARNVYSQIQLNTSTPSHTRFATQIAREAFSLCAV